MLRVSFSTAVPASSGDHAMCHSCTAVLAYSLPNAVLACSLTNAVLNCSLSIAVLL